MDDKGQKRRFRASNFQVCLLLVHRLPSIFKTRTNGKEKKKKLAWSYLIETEIGHAFLIYLFIYLFAKKKKKNNRSIIQSVTRVQPYICTMPMRLDPGWNQITFHLADFVRRAYGTQYTETLRITIHANCRLRRVYFTDRVYAEEELPPEFRLFLPVSLQWLFIRETMWKGRRDGKWEKEREKKRKGRRG